MSAPPAPKKARRSEADRMQEDSILCDDDEPDSSYTLYFVELPDGNPTEREIKNIQELFKIAADAGVMPEWIDSTSVDRIQSSDDFFVLPCFRGKLFRKLQAKKLKIYGPPIVLESIEERKLLPPWNHPVFSSVFEGAKITFTSIEPEKRRDLCEKISWMCGVFSAGLYHESTHLVAGKADQTEKYKVAVNNSIKLMRKEWIDDLWETSQTTMGKFSALGNDAINSYELKTFEGLEMAVTSIDGADRNNLIQLIEEHGGKIPGNMSKSKCSHLITDKTTGQKYLKASEWKRIKIVQTRWVRKCIDLGYLIDETKYHPKYLSSDHIRCSTPKKDSNAIDNVPDISSIAGHGGRLSASFNSSSVLTPLEQSCRRQSGSSFISMSSTSNVASTTIISNDVTVGRITTARQSDQFSTALARKNSVPVVRYPTTQSVLTQEPLDVVPDPIDDLRKKIDEGLSDLFENCLFYICGVDAARMEKWRRFLNETGATRAPKLESATNVVVIAPNQQERMALRKFMQQDDITIVTVQWVVECVKRRIMVPPEGFEWIEAIEDYQSQSQPHNGVFLAPNMSERSNRTSMPSCSNNTSMEGVFANQTYAVHPSLGKLAVVKLSEMIQNGGGHIEKEIEKAKFVVFGHSALMHELLSFDTVVTDLYIDFCITQGYRPLLKSYPLLVPLPRPPLLIFDGLRFFLNNGVEHLREYVKAIIAENGGTIVDNMDSNAYKIMLESGTLMSEPAHRARVVDFSWIVSSVSRCRLQPVGQYIYKENSKPLSEFERNDDVWIKCVQGSDTTDEMEQEIEERHRVQDKPVETRNSRKENLTAPYENPYFPDLRKPYKMNLHLEEVNEYIDNMESPARDTQDSITNSRIGSILRKAVINTGRKSGGENESEQSTCEVLKPRIAIAENRRTVSSTPVLVRDVERSMGFMPMDESFADQNQEHEELNRQYAMHPHFLLSVSNMNPQESTELNEAIRLLGGRVEKDFNRDVTHLITNNMQRTPKVLSAIAAGKWCLTPEYVMQSSAHGRWIDEKPFEWTSDKLPKVSSINETPKERDNRRIMENLVSVCRLWRNRIEDMPITASVRMENRSNGAFTGWRCVIHQDDKKTQQIASILEAGGATVHSVCDYIEITALEPNRVFAFKDFKWNPQSAAMLKRDKIPVYIFEIIYEYLIDKDGLDFSNYLHPVYKNVKRF